MIEMSIKTPRDLGLTIAGNVRKLRKSRKLSQKRLAEMSGMSYGSLKRFEATGEIALLSLLKIAIVLDCSDVFGELFTGAGPQSIQEIIDGKL